MRRVLVVLAVAVCAVAVVAASGLASGKAATVKTRHTSLGTFLVGPNGRTLYLFEKDKTTKSTCYGACAAGWPPLITSGKPRAAGAARASLLGTTRRRDGKRQVTYHGHPLYYFVVDKRAGQTKGQGVNAFGAKWYVVKPSGSKIDTD